MNSILDTALTLLFVQFGFQALKNPATGWWTIVYPSYISNEELYH